VAIPILAYADALRAGAFPPNIRGDRVFLPGGKVAERAVRAAALYFREYTHASSYLLERRAERRHATGGENALSMACAL
jgi:hypothetical protein